METWGIRKHKQRSFIQTIWWYVSQHFGCKYGRINWWIKPQTQVSEATGDKNSPVAYFEFYKEKRTSILCDCGPFHLGVIDNPKTNNVCFQNTSRDVNTINNMILRTPLRDLDRKSVIIKCSLYAS